MRTLTTLAVVAVAATVTIIGGAAACGGGEQQVEEAPTVVAAPEDTCGEFQVFIRRSGDVFEFQFANPPELLGEVLARRQGPLRFVDRPGDDEWLSARIPVQVWPCPMGAGPYETPPGPATTAEIVDTQTAILPACGFYRIFIHRFGDAFEYEFYHRSDAAFDDLGTRRGKLRFGNAGGDGWQYARIPYHLLPCHPAAD